MSTIDIAEDSTKFDGLIDAMMLDRSEFSFWKDFEGVRSYYDRLRRQIRQERVY